MSQVFLSKVNRKQCYAPNFKITKASVYKDTLAQKNATNVALKDKPLVKISKVSSKVIQSRDGAKNSWKKPEALPN